MKLQMEIENEKTEREIKNRRRITENTKMFKFCCKFGRKKENEQPTPEAERTLEFWKELIEKEEQKEKQEIGEDEEETKIKMWEIEISVKKSGELEVPKTRWDSRNLIEVFEWNKGKFEKNISELDRKPRKNHSKRNNGENISFVQERETRRSSQLHSKSHE